MMNENLKQLIFEVCNDWAVDGLPVTTAIHAAFMRSTGDRAKFPNALDSLARLALEIPKGELSSCPFCGGESAYGTVTYSSETIREQNWGQDTFHSVNCISCGTSNRGLVGYRTREEAKEHWNKRSSKESTP